MFDKIKKLFSGDESPAIHGQSKPLTAPDVQPEVVAQPVKEKKPRKPRKKKEVDPLPEVADGPKSIEHLIKPNEEKEAATKAGEPYVNVVHIDLDPDNIGRGSITLDYNEIFVARLVKAGYRGTTDYDIVDQWFTDLSRNVAGEL